MKKSFEAIGNYRKSLKNAQLRFNKKCDEIHDNVLSEFDEIPSDHDVEKQALLQRQQVLLDKAYTEFKFEVDKEDKKFLKAMEMAEKTKEESQISNLEAQIAAA